MLLGLYFCFVLILFYSNKICCLEDLDLELDEDILEYEIGSMVQFEADSFLMGTNDDKTFARKGEYPVHKEYVNNFKIDRYPVTNIDFNNFVREKSYYTTQPDLNKFSYVFLSHVNKSNEKLMIYMDKFMTQEPWMIPIVGVSWDKPFGDKMLNWNQRELHPVTHVSLADADAYCRHLNKRLPNEYEWELAARTNNNSWRYPWGYGMRRNRMNSWQGLFPKLDHGYDGFTADSSPVNHFPAQNQRGMYDMLGNVWEWTTTNYRGHDLPIGQKEEHWYVLKGGSYLESIENLEQNNDRVPIRLSTRIGRHYQYTAENVGFRCAQSIDKVTKKETRFIAYEDTYEYRQRVYELSKKFIKLRQKMKFKINKKMDNMHRHYLKQNIEL